MSANTTEWMAPAILAMVQDLLARQHPDGPELPAVDAVPSEEWWHVLVQPDRDPARTFEYYESLAKVELQIVKNHGISVLPVPVQPEAFEGPMGSP